MSAGAGSGKVVTKSASLIGKVGGGLVGGPVVTAWTAFQYYDTARWAYDRLFGDDEEL